LAKLLSGIDLEKILNVKKNEFGFVKLLFFHNFFQGVGLALFYTAANALFLAQASVKSLPLVYMLSALLLIGIGSLYSYIEQRFSVKRLLQFSLGLLVISILGLRVGIHFTQSLWIAFAMIMWYRVTSLLNYLEFWGLTSMLLDVRQSKRLFGLVSSGEVTAKLLGYFSVPALVPLVGNENLIVIAALAFAICLAYLNKIIRNYGKDKIDQSNKRHKAEEQENMLKKYLKSDFIVLLSILSFVAIISFTFIDFAFLSNVQQKYSTGEEIAVFFGLFFGINKGVTILVKMFLTGRIIDKLGIKNSLLFLPIVFLIITGSIIIYRMFSVQEILLFTLFASLAFSLELFRFSIFEPVFFSLFQPLSKKLRLFGHAVVNGFLNPIALGVAGVTLFLIIHFQDQINLGLISYLLIAILIIWMVVVIITNRQYIIVLQNAVKKRYFEGSEMPIQGKLIKEILLKKLDSPYPEETIYSAELLFKLDDKDEKAIIQELLHHQSVEVKKYAFTKIEQEKIKGLELLIYSYIISQEHSVVREAAIRAYCIVEENDLSNIFPFLEDNDPDIRKGTITGLLKSGDLEPVVLAGQQLLLLIQSDKAEENIIAAQIIRDLAIRNFFQPILDFFEHQDNKVVKAAIEASAKSLNPRFIPYLLKFLQQTTYSELAMQALSNYGHISADYIKDYVENLTKEEENIPQIVRICRVLGIIGGESAQNILVDFMNYRTCKVQNEALISLRKSGYKATGNDEIVRDKFEEQFNQASWLYQSIFILKQQNKLNESLIRALEIELMIIKENLFNLLSFLYDTRTVYKAREGLLADFSEKKANALEIIDNLITKKMAIKLSLIFEDLPPEERVKKLESYRVKVSSELASIPETILKEKDRKFNRWTQVSAIISILDFIKYELTPLLLPYLDNKNKLLSEAAQDTLFRIHQQSDFNLSILDGHIENTKFTSLMEKSTQGSLLDIEKVIILKSTSLFTETPENILVDIANIIREERVEEGKSIFSKGDMGTCMYIINEGEVSIHDGDLSLAILKNRDFFGELALLDPEPRSASAKATKDTLLLRLDQDAFYELMSERMEVAKGILKILCRRIRNQNEVIAGLKSKE
jgi:HEAT repeat protein